ncbi:MAG: histone deacetylase [Dehalococcoidales bacterium]|nr:histone deacetylase [Dehalococcoidales bacterium]
MSVGYVYDPVYLQHDTGYHSENANRLTSILSYLEKTGLLAELKIIKPRAASIDEIAAVHDREYISYLAYVAKNGGAWLEVDTVMSPKSYDAAVYAAGGTISATDEVMQGKVSSAFALVRPPGHHATYDRAMGFCMFNNIAIAAKYALSKYKLERIAIIDFDVHHGNGTQDAFNSDPHVLYVSTHQYPHYPGSGNAEDTGTPEGRGTILNVPMPAASGDHEYHTVFEKIIVPVAKRYKPQLIMVSAGYDIHWSDELAQMQVTTTGIADIVRFIKQLADEFCQGKIVIALEGGYNLEALSTSVKATFDVLMNKKEIEDIMGTPKRRVSNPDIAPLVKQLKAIHHLS